MYIYNALVTSVYDGDTITADIDLGFQIRTFGVDLRMYGIQAPEVKGDTRADGIIARDRLRSMIINKHVVIHTHKDRREKYGRYLVTVFYAGDNVNLKMIELGLAVPYVG